MKTEYTVFRNKPNYISVHKPKDTNNYTALQWHSNVYLNIGRLIGVWHIKYKGMDCNFS